MKNKTTLSSYTIAWLQIHFCVFLWGFTAVIGRVISLSAMELVFWRMLLVAVLLMCLPRVWRGLNRLSRRLLLGFSGIGALVALHWLAFYGSVKLANASVAATCMATLPIFMCFIEPLITGRRFAAKELLLGVLILPGMALVVGGTPAQMNLGIAVGVLSALLAAVFSAFNKRLILQTDSLTATGLEMLSGMLVMLGIILLLGLLPTGSGSDSAVLVTLDQLSRVPPRTDMLLLAVLALACTLLPFALSLKAMRHLSAYAAVLAVNLEPIYAMVLAALLLDEQQELNASFYLGAAIILAVVFLYPFVTRKERQWQEVSPQTVASAVPQTMKTTPIQ
ncbi:MAG: DMT family transporter [Gammaproteobacteria bacterium]|nr:EamA family transporter [Pseudomonadales bacterium]